MATLPTVTILGAGAMGGAILEGLLAPGVSVDGGVRVSTRSESSAAAWRERGVVAFATESSAAANREAVVDASIVLVGVKPAQVPALLGEVADALRPDAAIVSVAAGVTIATMESLVPASVAVLRAMPNTPALVGLGVTGLAGGDRADAVRLAQVTALFETVGTVLQLEESRIDALSTVSGSGPAYVFYLIEQLTATAMGLGFSAQEAATMVEGTFRGASELLAASGEAPAVLRRRVTSPKGTTERAIAVLEEAGLKEVFDAATAAALARARELAAGA